MHHGDNKNNELEIDFDKNQNHYVLKVSKEIIINTESICDELLRKILFMGFPTDFNNKVSNVTLSDIFETKHILKSNNAVCFLDKILKEVSRYNYFVLFAVGLDPQGVKFLYKIP